MTLTAAIPIPITSTVRSTASFYYNGQNGQPYSIVFNGDANADGKETLNLSTSTSPNFQGTFNRHDLRSRWQAQFGARMRF